MEFNLEPLINYIMLKTSGPLVNKLSAVKVIKHFPSEPIFKKLINTKISNNQSAEAQDLNLADEQVDAAVFLAWPFTKSKKMADGVTGQLIIKACVNFLKQHKDLLKANFKRSVPDDEPINADLIINKLEACINK